MLCRYVQSGAVRSWDGSGAPNSLQETEKLFVYGYFYPRHISKVTLTRVGTISLYLPLITTGFKLDCKGTWLGEDCAVEWLSLEFQASNLIPGVTEVWTHSLERFMNRNTHELATILDRVPLDTVN